MKVRNVVLGVLLSIGGAALADDAPAPTGSARIDIVGTASKVGITAGALGEGVKAVNGPGASGDAAKQSIAFMMPADPAQWKTMTFKFTPDADGKVQISLRGEFRKDAEVWVYYDAVEVTGATIENGDFEDAGKKDLPAKWTVRPGQNPGTVKDPAVVKSGKACVAVSHGNRLAQDFDVKAGTEVTVTLQTRLDQVTKN